MKQSEKIPETEKICEVCKVEKRSLQYGSNKLFDPLGFLVGHGGHLAGHGDQ